MGPYEPMLTEPLYRVVYQQNDVVDWLSMCAARGILISWLYSIKVITYVDLIRTLSILTYYSNLKCVELIIAVGFELIRTLKIMV